MNPISLLANLSTLKQNSPLPVYLSYIEPMYQSLPKELAKKIFKDENQELLTAFLGLENFSNIVLRNIRVKLKSPLGFEPQITSNERGRNVSSTFDKGTLEIVIDKIDPRESLSITVNPIPNELDRDFEPTIIIEDKLLTRSMQKRGFYKKNPFYFPIQAIAIGVILLAMFVTFFPNITKTFYLELSENATLINNAEEKLRYYGSCVNTIVENDSELDWNIKRSPMPLDMIYFVNNVDDHEQLMRKDKLVLCL